MDHESEPQQGQRLGFSFHRTFPCVRPAVTQILLLAEELSHQPELTLDNRMIRERTGLGTVYVEAMPRYATGAGLLDFNRELTEFGRYAAEHDPMLEQSGTQWLMHYYLSAPHGPGPAFWHNLVTTFFFAGNEFAKMQVERHIADFVEQTDGQSLAERTTRTAATIFLGSYTKSDALGNLRVLDELAEKRYRVREPVPPPVWAVAYALLDYWSERFEDRLTVSLDTLAEAGGFASLFLLGQQEFNEVLSALQVEHYVEVYRTVPPYQVVLLRRDTEPLLKNLYGTA